MVEVSKVGARLVKSSGADDERLASTGDHLVWVMLSEGRRISSVTRENIFMWHLIRPLSHQIWIFPLVEERSIAQCWKTEFHLHPRTKHINVKH